MTAALSDTQGDLKTSRASVRVTYFANQQWDGQQLVEVEKPDHPRRILTASKRIAAFWKIP
jgi:hypothetical protein